MDKLDSRGYVARDFTESRQNGQIRQQRICCKRFYRNQTKRTNQIVEDMLQEILQKADKMDKPDSRGYVAKDFTKSRQNKQTRH